MGYFSAIRLTSSTLTTGLRLTWQHFWQGLQGRRQRPQAAFQTDFTAPQMGSATLRYPYEALALPDTARNRLHNEIDDCIVCDKCAKVCPVDCIAIEAVKSAEPIGQTSDGTTKRLYAARFDIDMAKCCFCGLCTTVCPTECLTMTKTYDYPEADVRNLTYLFADLTPEEAEAKRQAYEAAQAEKKAKASAGSTSARPATKRPALRRKPSSES